MQLIIKVTKSIVCVLTVISFFQLFSCAAFTRERLFKTSKNPDIPVIDEHNDQLIKIQNENRDVSGLLSINSSKLCIIFHASRTTIKGDEINARTLYKNGFSILIPEYPGYGISSQYGATEKNIYSDVTAIIKYVLKKNNFKNDNIYLYGSSLGTGIATEMAKCGFGSKMVLVASFTSTADIVSQYIPFKFIVNHIVKDNFDNLSKAKSTTIPVLIIHGAEDELFPQYMPNKLHGAFINSNLVLIPKMTHKSIWKCIETTMIDSIIKFYNDEYTNN
jgi:alpha/beta superfamily hydrolase